MIQCDACILKSDLIIASAVHEISWLRNLLASLCEAMISSTAYISKGATPTFNLLNFCVSGQADASTLNTRLSNVLWYRACIILHQIIHIRFLRNGNFVFSLSLSLDKIVCLYSKRPILWAHEDQVHFQIITSSNSIKTQIKWCMIHLTNWIDQRS